MRYTCIIKGREHRSGYSWIKRAVRKRDRRRCRDCGFKPDRGESHKLHIHHITPKSEGGSDEMNNLIALCDDCHQKRHSNPDKTFPEEINRPEKTPEEELFPHECYHEDCDLRFPKEQGAQSHYSTQHGKQENGLYPWQEEWVYIWFNCDWCGELDEKRQKYAGNKKFCSNECYEAYRDAQ
ncbi:HNH endonuclease [Halobacteria archaeon AArc-m2/3/4]|uniref:HNH endonuclease n=1 Tax=Natronoglomus mannanivorans TaxID=2979990 RepID=A0ABT2QAU5_9EURY|nr:HNH endonuclease [Halobacteria archaeon AArc-m2/3/4]